MQILRMFVLIVSVALLGTACTLPGVADSEVAELPTVAQFPTLTATVPETNTPLPTITPPATETATATETPTETATETGTPTTSPTATWTPPPTLSPTATQTFTPSPSPTPLASATPLPTRTPNTPVINSFQSSTVSTTIGAPITLRWSVDAESAQLEIVDSSGAIIQTLDVQLVGTLTTNTPTSGNVVTYRLIATRGGGTTRSIITVDLGGTDLNCPSDWFFDEVPSSAGCPENDVELTPIVFQQFESGFMFRINVEGSARVCGVQTDRNLYSCYDALAFTGTPPVTPDAGEVVPNDALAQVFYEELATGGFWYDVIDFGTSASTTGDVNVQVGEDDNRIYIQLPVGIYAFDDTLTRVGASTSRLDTP